jgi:hypothetical protein
MAGRRQLRLNLREREAAIQVLQHVSTDVVDLDPRRPILRSQDSPTTWPPVDNHRNEIQAAFGRERHVRMSHCHAADWSRTASA